MPKAKGRAKQFADWEEKPVQDYDPETEPRIEDEESDDDDIDEDAGTEHYVSVGKSKLQRKDPVSLGPQYRGARVSRDALDQSSDDDEDDDEEEEDDQEGLGSDSEDYESAQEGFDDPDDADLERDQLEHDGEDAEIDSEDALGESDEERFKDFTFRGSSQALPVRGKKVKRPTASDFMDEEADESEDDEGRSLQADEDEEDDSEEDEDASDLEGFIDDGEDESEEEDDEDEERGSSGSDDDEDEAPAAKGKRGDLASTFASGAQNITGAIASSIQKDVAKGQAVRQQRKAFDAALNIRIRLQKALVAVNSFSASDETEATTEPYEAAEAAAVKLLNTIGDYRFAMQGKTGQKRKRGLDVGASSGDIWDSIQELERPAVARRKAVLENWSKKVKATQANNSGISKGSKFVKVDEPLTMLLENQLQDSERLIKRTRVPRSCAPVQVSQKVNEDADIYDDADFYQLLLKELVDQRTADTGAAGQAATIRYAAVKEAKNKKHVDTKASKGRKMRFNVHEKLQSFMAPEDRRGWEQHAIDRFFGTLFGQKMVLNEDEATDEEMGDDVDAAEAGLRLFRN
ncbi:apoptosis-antagonizing transcription factor [Truncatella angustata]|uniref:Protein BFR2 n=1 Tax=Truncatella angustata TaxID=152316 RepID=A0A9P8UCG4_9PEZI|nr:apoptosis-antagonizing transcription factor [Truncatella angustata]KAH6647404.1 apoptosis-antagonizing transcription factor [Truncatella angustata]